MQYGALDSEREAISWEIAERHLDQEPQFRERFGAAGVERCREDAAYLLAFLREALAADDSDLFVSYIGWAAILLESRHIGREHLVANLKIASSVLDGRLTKAESRKVQAYLQSAAQALGTGNSTALESHVSGERPIDVVARGYLAALLKMDRGAAYSLVIRALDEGTSIRELYLGVFERAQYEIGRLWQINAISVGQEHFCTAATQSIMSRLYDYAPAGPALNKTVIAICVSGELHEIGLRIICDFLEMDGWRTLYVGANTPTADVVQLIEREGADLLAISATMTFHVQRVREIVAGARSAGVTAKIIVGGLPFRTSPSLWQNIGADGFAQSAAELPALISRLGV